jgi:uncharacterized protein YjbI with pentapeptide repeats
MLTGGPKRTWWLSTGGLLVLLLAAAFVLFWLPPLVVTPEHGLTQNQRLARENDARKTGLQMLGGLLAIAAVATGYRSYRTNREGHVTDRYTRAVEQLGHLEIDVRIGGIYALERLMRDSPTDQPTVIEVLSAFARNRSRKAWDGNVVSGNYECPLDVQAAVTVIGRRGARTPDAVPDLSGAKLTGARMKKARLGNAVLVETNFAGADLTDADLHGADLRRADLRGAWLSGANLEKAEFTAARMANVEASGIQGRGLIAYKASLTSAKMLNAALEDADFTQADLTDARMQKSRFAGAHFEDAILQETHFFDADLRLADVSGTDWSVAYVNGALLPEAGLGKVENGDAE